MSLATMRPAQKIAREQHRHRAREGSGVPIASRNLADVVRIVDDQISHVDGVEHGP